MNKKVILKSLLILFPILAVGLATTGDSVTVFDTVSGQTQYYSYFDILPVGNLQMVTPLAALLCAFSGILAAIYMAGKKDSFLKASGYAALASAVLAAIPAALREAVLVLPHVALPIFMLLQYVTAYFLAKAAPDKEETGSRKRLKKH